MTGGTTGADTSPAPERRGMKSTIARLHHESLRLPPKLAAMIARYVEAANEGRDPVHLFRTGANLLNHTFQLADGGCAHTLAAMRRDGVNAIDLAHAAELLATAALNIEATTASDADHVEDRKDGALPRIET